MSITSISGGAAPPVPGTVKGQEAGVAVLRKIRQAEVAEATALIQMIEDAGAESPPPASPRGQNLNVYA